MEINIDDYICREHLNYQISIALTAIRDISNIQLPFPYVIFPYIMLILTSSANVSKFLFLTHGKVRQWSEKNFNGIEFKILHNRQVRDSMDHLNERIERFIESKNGYNLAYLNIGNRQAISGQNIKHLFSYDNDTKTIYSLNKELKEIHLNIDDLKSDLELVKSILENR